MTSAKEETEQGIADKSFSLLQGSLKRIFRSCESDSKGAIHKLWGVILILVVIDFIVSIFEMINIQAYGGSKALIIGSVWTAFVHVALAVMGTFVLKRFPTSFSLGFLLGAILILANQNLILFATFQPYPKGRLGTNHIYAAVSFILFVILGFFGILLAHFKEDVTVAAVDAKGLASTTMRMANGDMEGP